MNATMTKQRSNQSKSKRPVIVHHCSQEEILKRINVVLFGNGHPEDGLAFLVREFIKDQKDMVMDVANIRNDLGDLKGDYGKVKRSFERYKAEMVGFEAGKKEAEKNTEKQEEKKIKTKAEKRADLQKNLQTFALIVAALGLIFSTYFSWKGNQTANTTGKKVDEFGVPVVVTRSGNFYPLPDTVSIKVFPDSFNDTIK